MTSTTERTALSWYIDKIKSTALLTAQQERQLVRRIREHSDPIAREQMIDANLRLVVRIAKQYSNPGMTLSDLVAEGNLGLMRAVEEFDPDAGVRFSTYAAWWIKQAIRKAMINAGQPIHIPAYLSKLVNKWRRTSYVMEEKLGRPPTIEEMSAEMGISHKKAHIISQGLMAAKSPSQMANEDTRAISEMVADEDNSPEHDMFKACEGTIVQSLLDRLGARERRIVELRFGLDGYQGPQRTYKEIGEIMNLTRERVRQLANIAMAQLHEQYEKML